MVYSKKTSATFTSARVMDTRVIEAYENGSNRYHTLYDFECIVDGCFWISHLLVTIQRMNKRGDLFAE